MLQDTLFDNPVRQIEFIGCTGAGKSTLVRRILDEFRNRGITLMQRDDCVLGTLGLGWLSNHFIRTVCVDVASLAVCLLHWGRHRELFLFGIRRVLQLRVTWSEKIYLLRNFLKKIGIHELIRTHAPQSGIALIDEGALHAAHNLFVHVSARFTSKQLSTFTQLVPLPDVAVYIRQPDRVLIARTLERGHRRIPDLSYHSVERFIRQAVEVFEAMAAHPTIQTRLLLINGQENKVIAPDRNRSPLVHQALQLICRGVTQSAGGAMADDGAMCNRRKPTSQSVDCRKEQPCYPH